MAETLGMLCDKLTIIRLKEYHTTDQQKLDSLSDQASQLREEINEYIADAVSGQIDPARLTFSSNKVFKKGTMDFMALSDDFGGIFYQLSDINCQLWHEQEKVYEFEKVPSEEKDVVVKKLALLNIERNRCIDAINEGFSRLILQKNKQ